jgi:homoserine kinase type II
VEDEINFPDDLDQAAPEVLARYPWFPAPSRCRSLGNHGGFSGARLWLVERPGERLCLRAWPPGAPTAERLIWIHRLMHTAREGGLTFVPEIYLSRNRSSIVETAGRLWEVARWMPGQADFRIHPSHQRLIAVGGALARLHTTWSRTLNIGPCPAVQRRLAAARDWAGLIAAGWQLPERGRDGDPAYPWAARAWKILPGQIARLHDRLGDLADRLFPLQPCLCDIWHDNVLFNGDRLTGVIDYGSVKIDHVAVDLARLLGSLTEDDGGLRKIGLEAYVSVRPLSTEESQLIELLDVTGTVLGIANWIQRLYRDRIVYRDRSAVARRLAALVDRVERWC